MNKCKYMQDEICTNAIAEIVKDGMNAQVSVPTIATADIWLIIGFVALQSRYAPHHQKSVTRQLKKH